MSLPWAAISEGTFSHVASHKVPLIKMVTRNPLEPTFKTLITYKQAMRLVRIMIVRFIIRRIICLCYRTMKLDFSVERLKDHSYLDYILSPNLQFLLACQTADPF